MKLMLIVPDGIGIKNYLYSDFLQKLIDEQIEVHVVSKPDINLVSELSSSELFHVYQLPNYNESFIESFLRETEKHARLKFFSRQLNNPTILNSRSLASTFQKKVFLSCCRIAGTLTSYMGYDAILAVNKWYRNVLAKKDLGDFEQLFQRIKPDAILSTHQRPIENIPMYEHARRVGVLRTSVIYSWDNVVRSALNTRSDYYFLWSNFMYKQMRLFYREIPADQLVVTGTPQFSFYLNPAYQWKREDFDDFFGLPKGKGYIIFSGSDLKTSPYDPELLEDVYSAIATIPADERPVLIFRRTPADFSNRYDEVLARHKDIISIDPLWINNGTTWNTAIPTREDIRNIVGLIQHCSLVINVGSTMAIDCATHNKPCIYIAYSPKSAPYFDYDAVIHGEDHFKVLRDIDAVCYVKRQEELAPLLHGILKNPASYATERTVMLERVTDNIIVEAADNLVGQLRKLAVNNNEFQKAINTE